MPPMRSHRDDAVRVSLWPSAGSAGMRMLPGPVRTVADVASGLRYLHGDCFFQLIFSFPAMSEIATPASPGPWAAVLKHLLPGLVIPLQVVIIFIPAGSSYKSAPEF